MEDGDDEITITNKEYGYLLNRDYWLSALEAAGVDNWSGWDLAVEIQQGEED